MGAWGSSLGRGRGWGPARLWRPAVVGGVAQERGIDSDAWEKSNENLGQAGSGGLGRKKRRCLPWRDEEELGAVGAGGTAAPQEQTRRCHPLLPLQQVRPS
jgi:hypothetical protein